MRELAIKMLLYAWYPYFYFRLSFGSQDKVNNMLEELAHSIGHQEFDFNASSRKDLYKKIEICCSDSIVKKLLRYVPYRFIRGFFAKDLHGVRDWLINDSVSELSQRKFDTSRPIYKINTSQDAIMIHPDWITYFQENLPIIKGWVAWEWTQYMQMRNPNVPAVPSKLFPPQKRASIMEQRKYWEMVLSQIPIICIYSGLTIKEFELDHFIPWSYVAHDRIWNLIPVKPEINSAKRDMLPSEKYLNDFSEVQTSGLIVTRAKMEETEWNRLTDGFITDLRIEPQDLRGEESKLRNRLHEAYNETCKPLMGLAKRQGFITDWIYSGGK